MRTKDFAPLLAGLAVGFGWWLFSAPVWPAAPSPVVPYSALKTNDFRITNGVVGVRSSLGGGTNVFQTIFVTNVTYTSNLFATNIYVSNLFVTNIDASVTVTTNLFVTNIFNTFLVTSNIVAGNVHGTTNTLAMFTPDEFSVGDSIVTQPDTNTIVVNGSGTGFVQLGGTNNEQIVFGTGGTNYFVREGNVVKLAGFNGVSSVPTALGVTNLTDATEARFSAGGNLAFIASSAGVELQDSLSAPRTLRWFAKYFAPPAITDAQLGADNNSAMKPFGTVNELTNQVWGFRDTVSTNWARLHISHSGTNGAAVLDSQSSGTAGDPRPIQLNFGATNQWTFVPSGPAISAGITKAQKTALTPTNGMIVYQTDNTPGFRVYVSGTWFILSTAADP